MLRAHAGTLHLELIRKGRGVRTWRVPGDQATLGSGEECSVRLRGVPGLLPLHAVFQVDDGMLTVTPSGGADVLLNGVSVDLAVLGPGDVVSLGRVDLTARWEPPPRPQPTSSCNAPKPARSAPIVVEVGSHRRELRLPPGSFTIGSGRAAIRLRFHGVAERHAELTVDRATIRLTAVGGPVVRNGLRTRSAELKAGDVFEIGAARIWRKTTRRVDRLQLDIPHDLLRTDTALAAEPVEDPETVRMSGMERWFDGPPPPTVKLEPPPSAVVDAPREPAVPRRRTRAPLVVPARTDVASAGPPAAHRPSSARRGAPATPLGRPLEFTDDFEDDIPTRKVTFDEPAFDPTAFETPEPPPVRPAVDTWRSRSRRAPRSPVAVRDTPAVGRPVPTPAPLRRPPPWSPAEASTTVEPDAKRWLPRLVAVLLLVLALQALVLVAGLGS